MARGPVYNIAVSDKARAVRYMFMADQPVKWPDKERQQIAKEARYWRCKSNQIISNRQRKTADCKGSKILALQIKSNNK